MVESAASDTRLVIATWAMAGILAFVTIVGWWIIDRQRKKQFLLEVRNKARLSITLAIRDYQRWLHEVARQYVLLMCSHENPKPLLVLRELEAMDTHLGWIFQLEENEAIYPETLKCRTRMMLADMYMREKIRVSLADPDHISDIEKGVIPQGIAERVLQGYQYTPGLIALMEDLRVYLQNACFRGITKNKVTNRERDPNRPYLEYNKKRKMLEIVPPTGHLEWPPLPHEL